uniref:Trehalase n=1 Tax=Denticeps clupeoides TaxID=299321 RepID=A0AAY4E4K4_9TELE
QPFVIMNGSVVLVFLLGFGVNALPSPCDSEIYCTGELLRQVQTAKLFDDDKHYVDMKLTAAPDVVLEAFRNLTSRERNRVLPPATLREFLHKFFDDPGTEFEPWTPTDWHEKPRFLSKIKDPDLHGWAEELHLLWKSLGRKVILSDHPELHSMIYIPNPVIVPGGRFREFYYWDSYWIINGLLLSEMTDTARGMIENFLYLVDRYGFIPNGGRIYYERRSQPPFLTLMVKSYYDATKDKDFLMKAIPTLEKEYRFWMQNRSVAVEMRGQKWVLNHHRVEVGEPSDSLVLPIIVKETYAPPEAKEKLYMELHSGAESGWDFSSRWFVGNGQSSSRTTLRDIYTSALVPTDLNALMCLNERTVAGFHEALGNKAEAMQYHQAYVNRLAAVQEVLWDPEKGAWFDYNLLTNRSEVAFYPTNLAPVWAGCFNSTDMALRSLQYLKASGALQYPNGVPTSLKDSGQQWDLPNAWPPLQQLLIQGLSETPSEEAQELAFELAQRWIRTNWLAYIKYEAMFEKYDVNGDGKPGGGGEYEVQLGFGWSNGVALQLLDEFGDRLTSAAAALSVFPPLALVSMLLIVLSVPLQP